MSLIGGIGPSLVANLLVRKPTMQSYWRKLNVLFILPTRREKRCEIKHDVHTVNLFYSRVYPLTIFKLLVLMGLCFRYLCSHYLCVHLQNKFRVKNQWYVCSMNMIRKWDKNDKVMLECKIKWYCVFHAVFRKQNEL